MNTAMDDWKEIGALLARVAQMEAALRLNYDFLTKALGYDSHDFLVQSTETALGIPTLALTSETQCPPCQLELGGKRCGDCGYAKDGK